MSAYKNEGRLLKPGVIVYNSGELNVQFGGDDTTGIYACTDAIKFAGYFSNFIYKFCNPNKIKLTIY
jgi:hypothetical protein